MPKSDIATISPLLMMAGLLVPAFTGSIVTARKYLVSYADRFFILFPAISTYFSLSFFLFLFFC